ncbi:MAG TPA: CBS domain-containing protein [Terriglobales bacterium]|jgi:CBS domain-containing protein
MRVQDIMTPDPACCTRYAALTDVARLMRDHDCGAIPVVEDDSRKLIGIISDRDIVVHSLGHGRNPFHLMASDCMTMVVATVRPEDSVEECAKRMQEHKVRRIPVVDGQGNCCGIVAQADLARHVPKQTTGQVVRELSQPAGACASK